MCAQAVKQWRLSSMDAESAAALPRTDRTWAGAEDPWSSGIRSP